MQSGKLAESCRNWWQFTIQQQHCISWRVLLTVCRYIPLRFGLLLFSFTTSAVPSSTLATVRFAVHSGKSGRGTIIHQINHIFDQMSRLVGKPTICICENKAADQLRGNHEADQRLCFRYSDSTIPLLLKSEISRF